MVRVAEIVEAYSVGKMPEIDKDYYQNEYTTLVNSAIKIVDLRENMSLYCYNNTNYILIRDDGTIIGNIILTPRTIAGKQYLHVDGIFVAKQFRKTSALYWILYGVKEVVTDPVIADGAIFKDGNDLIVTLQKHKYFNVSQMNVNTGEISPLPNEPIHDHDHCYLFKPSKLGFSKKYFGETMAATWYDFFGDILNEETNR